MPRALLVVIVLLFCLPAHAQTIRGEVLDMETKAPVADVKIENVHTSLEITSGAQGAFIIAAASGQLLEFSKPGYKTTRVRIPQGYVPSFFRIIMSRGVTEIRSQPIAGARYDYRTDSMRNRDVYAHELDFHRLTTFESIAHPFSALSKTNREIWQFQDLYEETEHQKYVDRTFSADLITKVTGLTGDSLKTYMRRFRPSYEQVRSMNDYTFFNYIKSSAKTFRSHNNPRNAN